MKYVADLDLNKQAPADYRDFLKKHKSFLNDWLDEKNCVLRKEKLCLKKHKKDF